MSDAIATVEAAFVSALTSDVDELADVLDHEPGQEGLPRFPCVTMLYLGSRRVGEFTSAADDIEHNWDVFLYLELKDFRKTQLQLKELVPKLLDAVRHAGVLAGSEKSDLLDELARPEFFRAAGYAVKRLALRTRETAL